MRSFKVTRVPDTAPRLRVGVLSWDQLTALACRDCEDAKGVGVDETEFIPDCEIRVGQLLACPFCGVQSSVPKRARWS